MGQILPNVAVLLAAYNGSAFIEEQLQSILRQQSVRLTIYISVDLSSDDCYQRCCDFAKKHPQIIMLAYGQKFGGAAANFYRLIKDVDFSDFDYVALADQDDIWLDDKLLTACTKLEQGNYHAYSGNVLAFWPDGRELLINKALPQRKYDYLFEAAGPGCTYVLRTEPMMLFKDLLQEKWPQAQQVILHDWFIYAFFRASDLSWFIDPDYKLLYRQHPDNQVGIHKGWQASIKRLGLLHNGWCKQQVVRVSSLINEHHMDVHSRWSILKNISQLRRRFRDRCILFFIAFCGLY
ncbi:rhamnosyltransferase [Bathymodiolus platifrons methanotrophic gill symbiont]|nr:glycosyltransferase [Methyloprofundus sp.]TXK95610.1 glycosyl transferase [Methylococcaceae bacterium CS5]TXK95922.1 glycosyl transferase [Methylococcaceae bacterium CS4]TXL02909.1 glycosyl transferase [Methylococcaceae bacterium CS1]TXL06424.1 glycosyl transferase [Methylococcaceae bacterium CS3]TXL11598.1 glycosyl transferase [Methylococcaceae bacterium CS2]TXL14587.1 glycosyl transferase [Methylococcaceae bacterium HT4]TXL19982.1 glycosyl transferase [Methylococcaceae bacterium HT5]GA